MVSAVPLYNNGSSGSDEKYQNSPHDEEYFNGSTSPTRRTSRKQWSIQGEPQSILRRLRSQLAEDGCAESQYLMAKMLLECRDAAHYEDHCKQAVFWLTQSSLQGNQIATDELRQAFEKGLGICEENYEDVKRCLSMDQQEKLAQVAGKQLFCSLCKGNEFVTIRKLNKKIYEIVNNVEDKDEDDCNDSQVPNLDKSSMEQYLEERYGSERISEDMIVDAAKTYVRGAVPEIQIKHCCKDASRAWRVVHKAHLSFLYHLHKPFDKILNIPPFCGVILLVCGLGLIYYADKALLLFSYFLWFIAFMTMFYSATTAMIHHLNIRIFNVWSLVLKKFSSDLDITLAFLKFRQKYFRLYVAYIISMLVYLSFLPMIHSSLRCFILPPLLFASAVMFLVLFKSNAIFNLLSSFLYVFAHYSKCHPYVRSWLINVLPVTEPYLLNGTIHLTDSLMLHYNIGSVFHCLWLVSLLSVSVALGLSGVLHHILCVTWFHITVMAVKGEPGFSDLISLSFWLFIILLPYSLSLVTVAIPTVLVASCLVMIGAGPMHTAIISFCLGFVLLVGSKLFFKIILLLKGVLVIVSLAFLLNHHMNTSHMVSSLKWEQYQNICLPSRDVVSALTVKNCRPLQGTVVQWQAFVKEVEVDSVFNWAEVLVSQFPKVIQPILKCLVGSPSIPCNRDHFGTELEYHQCLLMKSIKGSECSLQNWNSYKFRITVSMESNFWKFRKSPDVILMGGHEFEDIAFALSIHDKISFIGTLDNGIGTNLPEISLISIACIDCLNKNMHLETSSHALKFDVKLSSLRSAVNFFLSPTLSI